MTDKADKLHGREQERLERIIRQMVRHACARFPDAPVDVIFGHVDGAIQIMNDTQLILYNVRLAIVKDEYNRMHKVD